MYLKIGFQQPHPASRVSWPTAPPDGDSEETSKPPSDGGHAQGLALVVDGRAPDLARELGAVLAHSQGLVRLAAVAPDLLDDQGAALAAIINDTVKRGGKIIVPSFAIGRVEEVIYWLKRLEDEKRIPVLPVYIDSPMAAGAMQFYAQHLNELDPELSTGLSGQRQVGTFYTTRMTIIETVEQSLSLAKSRDQAIVIAASVSVDARSTSNDSPKSRVHAAPHKTIARRLTAVNGVK